MSAVQLRDPSTWVLYPILPLVNRCRCTREEPRGALGFLVAGRGPVVYRGNVLDEFPSLDLSRYPSTEYETIDAVLDDGWVVD